MSRLNSEKIAVTSSLKTADSSRVTSTTVAPAARMACTERSTIASTSGSMPAMRHTPIRAPSSAPPSSRYTRG